MSERVGAVQLALKMEGRAVRLVTVLGFPEAGTGGLRMPPGPGP